VLRAGAAGPEDRDHRTGRRALLAGKEWKPHKIQGWTPDFVPRCSTARSSTENLPIDDVLARDTARRLAPRKASSSASPPAPPSPRRCEVAERAEPAA
jgi:cysteine synthase